MALGWQLTWFSKARGLTHSGTLITKCSPFFYFAFLSKLFQWEQQSGALIWVRQSVRGTTKIFTGRKAIDCQFSSFKSVVSFFHRNDTLREVQRDSYCKKDPLHVFRWDSLVFQTVPNMILQSPDLPGVHGPHGYNYQVRHLHHSMCRYNYWWEVILLLISNRHTRITCYMSASFLPIWIEMLKSKPFVSARRQVVLSNQIRSFSSENCTHL